MLFLCSSCCLSSVGTRGGAGALQGPAPPLRSYKSVHRRSSGIHVGDVVFVGVTVVASGIHLPVFLKRNCGLKVSI